MYTRSPGSSTWPWPPRDRTRPRPLTPNRSCPPGCRCQWVLALAEKCTTAIPVPSGPARPGLSHTRPLNLRSSPCSYAPSCPLAISIGVFPFVVGRPTLPEPWRAWASGLAVLGQGQPDDEAGVAGARLDAQVAAVPADHDPVGDVQAQAGARAMFEYCLAAATSDEIRLTESVISFISSSVSSV